jgi:hypothetical protein
MLLPPDSYTLVYAYENTVGDVGEEVQRGQFQSGGSLRSAASGHPDI